MCISDWSSDVCSSDLNRRRVRRNLSHPGDSPGDDRIDLRQQGEPVRAADQRSDLGPASFGIDLWQSRLCAAGASQGDRKSVVSGKSVSVRVDLCGRRIIKKKKYK